MLAHHATKSVVVIVEWGTKRNKNIILYNRGIGIFVLCVEDFCLQRGLTRLSPTPPVDCLFALPVIVASIPVIY